jgi:homocysteine S-methyltransferase
VNLGGDPRGENPLQRLVRDQGFFVLDGGLATALEAMGFDLNDPLWSARVLLESPEAIRRVHLDFLEAGADCIVTSSYQATLEGFGRRGLGISEGVELLHRSVRLGVEARDAFWSEPRNRQGRLRPLVAASVGPYGAYLADGSEFTGDYDLDDEGLYAFHRPRWRILADAGADLLACETLPSRREARVLLRVLEESPETWAWMSFSCRDGTRLCDRSRFGDVVCDCDAAAGVAAVGVNCTAPPHISSLLREGRRVTDRTFLVYPNSGETWDASRKVWSADPTPLDWGAAAREWYEAGAAGIGGCCRVAAADIARVRGALQAA